MFITLDFKLSAQSSLANKEKSKIRQFRFNSSIKKDEILSVRDKYQDT